jgi:adenosylhomocysteine nucleosidase
VYLVVTPLEHEARGLERVLSTRTGPPEFALQALRAMGEAAADVLDAALSDHGPEALVYMYMGFAGALDDSLREGDLVLGARTCFRGGNGVFGEWMVSDESLLDLASKALVENGIGHKTGDILTTPAVIGSPREKEMLGTSCDALVVDMESSWAAQVAADHGVPLLMVRAVLDRSSLKIPTSMMLAASRPQWVQWLWGALVSLATPWNIPALIQLRRCSGIASEKLACFLEAFVEAATARPDTAVPRPIGRGGQ